MRFNGRGAIKPWLQAMNSFYDAEHFESDARLTYTMHLLSPSALEVAEHVRPSTYSALCTLLIQSGEGLDAYVAHFMALHARGSATWMPVSDPCGPTLRHISSGSNLSPIPYD